MTERRDRRKRLPGEANLSSVHRGNNLTASERAGLQRAAVEIGPAGTTLVQELKGDDVVQAELLFGGRGLVESPRWHDGHFWFADWTAGEILRIGDDGRPEVRARLAGLPL